MADNKRPSSSNRQDVPANEVPSDAATTTTSNSQFAISQEGSSSGSPHGDSSLQHSGQPRSAAAVSEEEQEHDQLHEEEEEEGDNEEGEPDAVVIHRPRAVRTPRSRENRVQQDQAGHAQNNFVLTWAISHYYYEHNHNVPRSGMYQDYLATCTARNIQPVNCATFGKLIRHIFPRITTRRLGVRGQSRYHYCGIRRRMDASPRLIPTDAATTTSTSETSTSSAPVISTTSPTRTRQQRRRAVSTTSSPYPITTPSSRHAPSSALVPSGGSSVIQDTRSPTHPPTFVLVNTPPPRMTTASLNNNYQQQQSSSRNPQWRRNYTTTSSVSAIAFRYEDNNEPIHLASFAPLQFSTLKDNTIAHEFSHAYQQHCQEILDYIRNNQIDELFAGIRSFYRMLPDRFRNAIRSTPDITEAVWRWDCSLYDAIISSVIPKVYTPTPFHTLDRLRTYTGELLPCIEESLRSHYPETFVMKKLGVAEVFVSKFRRHLKLNFLANDVAAMIMDLPTVENMQHDWTTIDFDNVVDQSYWLCQCDPKQIKHILQFDVYNLLSTNADLDCWITWLKGIVHRFLRIPTQQAANDLNDYMSYAREFIFKWTYLTALLIKDLSASHASSEESFRIMQLFFDDLVLYLVEQKLSKMALCWHSSQDSTAASSPLPRPSPSNPLFTPSLSVKRLPPSIGDSPFIVSSGSNENTGVIAKLAEPPTDATDKPSFEGETA